MSGYDDYQSEGGTVLTIGSAYRVARKKTDHTCQCGREIRPGTRYQRLVEKVDGEVTVTKIAEHTHKFELEEAAYNRKYGW